MRKHQPIAISVLLLTLLAGCTPPAVVKKDVQVNADKVREDVIDLQSQDMANDTDLNKVDTTQVETAIKPSNIVEIKGKERGLKFSDANWKDFPVTLDLNVVPIRTFFETLHRLTKINFVVGDEVKGDVSINLKGVGWVEALDIVVKNKNLISDVNESGTVVTIHSPDFVATQSDSIQKALSSRIAAVKAFSNLESKTTAIIKLNYAKPDVVAQQLKDIVATLEATGGSAGAQGAGGASSRASFVIDSRTNSIIIQATTTDLEWIKSAILNLDKATRQVLVEVFIVEASDDFQMQLGSRVGLYNTGNTRTFNNASIAGTLAGTPPTAAGTIDLSTTAGSLSNTPISGALGGVALAFSSAKTDLRMELQAMQKESLIKIVSNPKLFIIDNEQATITDGTEVPYTATAQLGASPSVQFKNAALQLQVKPSVIGDGNVYLDLVVNKDTPLTGSPPPISKKELKTKLLIKDGGVAMIGGINKSEATATEDGVPLIGKLPLIGNLFKSKGDVNKKNQLYIFLAPKVL